MKLRARFGQGISLIYIILAWIGMASKTYRASVFGGFKIFHSYKGNSNMCF